MFQRLLSDDPDLARRAADAAELCGVDHTEFLKLSVRFFVNELDGLVSPGD